MDVLVINCGSSSLKYQLINSETESVLAAGACERIGIDGGFLKHKASERDEVIQEVSMPDHETAIGLVLRTLTDKENGVIASLKSIHAVGHRVVHGGEKFTSSVLITEKVLEEIQACNDLAPLHNPANLIGIRACAKALPGRPMVAVFDTAFHQTMPPEAYLYGIPHRYYVDYKIRRYGFHGTSHSYVSKKLCEAAGLPLEQSKLIVCHLGNGSSVSAVLNGKSIDTSMGLTPLAGLIMGTRSGDIDPAIIEYIARKEGKGLEEVLEILNKESGVLGMSELSSDFRDLEEAAENGNELAEQAVDAFCYRVVKYIGSYTAAMGGVDAIAFTAGLGENGCRVRQKIMHRLRYMGIELDDLANQFRGIPMRISTASSNVAVFVIPTNEELAIMRETVAIVGDHIEKPVADQGLDEEIPRI